MTHSHLAALLAVLLISVGSSSCHFIETADGIAERAKSDMDSVAGMLPAPPPLPHELIQRARSKTSAYPPAEEGGYRYTLRGKRYRVMTREAALSYKETGTASFYGAEAGSQTANGERYDPLAMTAAHKTLPFGSHVRVTNLSNGRSATFRINDRGPFVRGRIIDVSAAGADELGFVSSGVTKVRVEVL